MRQNAVVRGGRVWVALVTSTACSAGVDGNSSGSAASVGEGSSGTGSASATSTTSVTGGSGAVTTAGSTSSGAAGTGTTGSGDGPPWVLSIDDQGAVARLLRIDLDTGLGSELCLLPAGRNYNSAAFSRDGVLFAHSVTDAALDRIDPCTCDTVRIGDMLASNTQLTADAANGLYGITLVDDMFISINPTTAAFTPIGPLGVDFEGTGLAWSDGLGAVWGLEATTDQLFLIDVQSGAAGTPVPLTVDFGTVGLDFHPGRGVLYGCSNDTALVTIDPTTGVVTPVGNIGGSECDNLAAPWGPIACIDD